MTRLSKAADKHRNFDLISRKFKSAILKANWEKFFLPASNVAYLGHVVTTKGVKSNPDNLKSRKNIS